LIYSMHNIRSHYNKTGCFIKQIPPNSHNVLTSNSLTNCQSCLSTISKLEWNVCFAVDRKPNNNGFGQSHSHSDIAINWGGKYKWDVDMHITHKSWTCLFLCQFGVSSLNKDLKYLGIYFSYSLKKNRSRIQLNESTTWTLRLGENFIIIFFYFR